MENKHIYLPEAFGITTQTLVDLSPDFTVVHDMEGNIVLVNQVFEHLLGYSKKELLTMAIRDFDPLFVPGTVHPVWEKKPVILERELIRKDGTRIPVELHLAVLNIQDKEYILGIGRDITLRKEAEQKLARYAAEQEELNRMKDKFLSIIAHDHRDAEPVACSGSFKRDPANRQRFAECHGVCRYQYGPGHPAQPDVECRQIYAEGRRSDRGIGIHNRCSRTRCDNQGER